MDMFKVLPEFLHVEAFIKLSNTIAKVIETQVDMPIVGVVSLYVSLLTFTLRVHPDRLDYVDQILLLFYLLSANPKNQKSIEFLEIDDANPKTADENEQSVEEILSIVQEARKPGEGVKVSGGFFGGSMDLDDLDLDADIDDIEMSGDFVYAL